MHQMKEQFQYFVTDADYSTGAKAPSWQDKARDTPNDITVQVKP